MHTEKFTEWLKSEKLSSMVESNYMHFLQILNKCLEVKDEQVLIIGDYGYPTRRIAPIITGCYLMAAKEIGLKYSLVMQDPKAVGEPAEDEIIQGLFTLPEKSIIIQVQSGRIGSLKHLGKSYRRFCKDNGHRFVSTMSLGDIDTYLLKRVIQPIMVNYDDLKDRHKMLMEALDKGKQVHILTKAGTDIKFDIDGINSISNDGMYNKVSTGGNIPAGEVYLPPENSNGTVVIDLSSRNSNCTALIEKPIIIKVKDGRVTSITGGDEADLLNKSLDSAEARSKFPERVRVLAELGIGTNPKAKILGSTIVDEKAYGTAHVAIGSNYWFGGKNRTIIHLDQIFNKPRIYIDSKRFRV